MTAPGSRPRYIQPSKSRFFATFGYAWVTIATFTATLALVLLVRAVLAGLTRAGFDESMRYQFFLGVAIVFVIGSFVLARRVVRTLYRQAPRTRQITLVLLGVAALLSTLAWAESPPVTVASPVTIHR